MYSQIIKKTFDDIFAKKNELIKALFIPLVLFTIIEYYLPTTVLEDENTELTTTMWGFIALYLFVSVIMSITVHRIMLLSKDKTPTWGILKISKREFDFILRTIGIIFFVVFVSVIFIILVTFIGSFLESILGSTGVSVYNVIGMTFAGVFVGVTFSRVSLIFPSIAIDKPIDMSDALSITKDHKLFMFLVVFVIPVTLGSIVSFAYGLVINFISGIFFEELRLLYGSLNIFVTLFLIAFLSSAYEFVMNEKEKNEESEENLSFAKEEV